MNDKLLDQDRMQESKIGVDSASFTFSKTTADELAQKMATYFLEKGYVLESGTTENGIYGKGSKVLRLLFGAFVKRFTWQIKISTVNDKTILQFSKDGKGYLGGVIGVTQVSNEYQRIIDTITHFHATFKKPMV